MYQLLALVRDTFRELLVRKVLIGFLILNAAALVVLAIYVNGSSAETAAQTLNIPLTDEVRHQYAYGLEFLVAGIFDLMMILVSIFATASVVPTMLEKGTIDLYLSKPLSRPKLLFGKVLGSISVVSANIALFILGAWIIFSLKLGIWNAGFLAAGGMMIFMFTVLYAIIVFFNMITRGGALGTIIVFAHTLLLAGALANRDKNILHSDNSIVKGSVTALYYILPQTADHATITGALIMHGTVASWSPVWLGLAFAVVMYSVSAWLFSRREF